MIISTDWSDGKTVSGGSEAMIRPKLQKPGIGKKDWAINFHNLPDPRHFADGQQWAVLGLRALAQSLSEGQRQMVLENLFHHFDAGGNIATALKWMTICVPELSCRERRCATSYVVRWVRVRQVTRRMQEAVKPAFSVDDPPFQQLRRTIISVLKISEVFLAHREARGLTVTVPSLSSSLISVAAKLVDVRMARKVSVGRDCYSYADACIEFTPAGVKWLADSAAIFWNSALSNIDQSALEDGLRRLGDSFNGSPFLDAIRAAAHAAGRLPGSMFKSVADDSFGGFERMDHSERKSLTVMMIKKYVLIKEPDGKD